MSRGCDITIYCGFCFAVGLSEFDDKDVKKLDFMHYFQGFYVEKKTKKIGDFRRRHNM